MKNNPSAGAGTLANQLFAIYYNLGERNGNFIDFGDADTSIYANGATPHTFAIKENDFQWNIAMSVYHYIPANSNDQEHYFNMVYWAMVSSSHEMIYIPYSLGDDFEG